MIKIYNYFFMLEIMVEKAKPCCQASKKCVLGITEKYSTLLYKSSLLHVNKRSEISGTCLHRKKWLLQNTDICPGGKKGKAST